MSRELSLPKTDLRLPKSNVFSYYDEPPSRSIQGLHVDQLSVAPLALHVSGA